MIFNPSVGMEDHIKKICKSCHFRLTNIYKILQSAWSYRREVWCNPAGDEICHPGLNSPIVSLHYLLIYYLDYF